MNVIGKIQPRTQAFFCAPSWKNIAQRTSLLWYAAVLHDRGFARFSNMATSSPPQLNILNGICVFMLNDLGKYDMNYDLSLRCCKECLSFCF